MCYGNVGFFIYLFLFFVKMFFKYATLLFILFNSGHKCFWSLLKCYGDGDVGVAFQAFILGRQCHKDKICG